MTLASDPIDADGIEAYGRRLRAGAITAEAATAACLQRIAALDGALHAFEHVAGEAALADARAVDRALSAGRDFGPLTGVPVAVKDLFAVSGMPVTAGSAMPVDDLVGAEGAFVRRLRACGCIVVGKTRTVEFALGGTGINTVRGTPRNPWDATAHRLPGGSSSGSAVATAAGLAAFAVGTDSGGSVRIPAALNGLFGLKTTPGTFPADGLFPLSPSLDSIGLLCRSAADAALAFRALTGATIREPSLHALRLGLPSSVFFAELEAPVAEAIQTALEGLRHAGARLIEIDVPELGACRDVLSVLLPFELLRTIGRERFAAALPAMDPYVGERAATALGMSRSDHGGMLARHRDLTARAARRFEGLDGWLAPTVPMQAPLLPEIGQGDRIRALGRAMNRNTLAANVLSLCAATLPVAVSGGGLPVGLQLLAPGTGEREMLGTALALEAVLGLPPRPDVLAFDGVAP